MLPASLFSATTYYLGLTKKFFFFTNAGSGPAYFFALVEHLTASATALGLSPEQATRLAKQTCLGAGRMLAESA